MPEWIRRVGVDGYESTMLVETMGGLNLKVNARSTVMVSVANLAPTKQHMMSELERFENESVTYPKMFEVLRSLRQNHRSDTGFIKISFSHEYDRRDFTVAFESWIGGNRLKSYLSVAVPFPERAVTRISIDFPAGTSVSYEEILSIVDEIEDNEFEDLLDFTSKLSWRMNQYERIQDYLILSNQVVKSGKPGSVIQMWKGNPGGFRPMPGLERFVPDV